MSAKPSRLAVVILNYRTPVLVLAALASLEPELDPSQDAAIVIDNASGDGSTEHIADEISKRGWDDWVLLLRSESNGGFAVGNNLGIRAQRAQFVLLLNSDAYVRPGAVATLLAAAAAEPRAGVLGPRLEWPDGSPQGSCFRNHSPISELIDAAGTGPVTRALAAWNVPIPASASAPEPQWTSFACALLRAECIAEVGLLDEGYFMYFDDADYCRRVRARGWSVQHVPSARVVHLRGGTSPVKKRMLRRERLPRHYYASRARYFAKFYGTPGLWLANLCWLLGHSLSGLRQILGGRPASTCEAQWRDIWHKALAPLSVDPAEPG